MNKDAGRELFAKGGEESSEMRKKWMQEEELVLFQ